MTDTPTLASLESIAYLDSTGQIPDSLQGQVGVYGIFDQAQVLQYVGYSRDVYLSLKQHLVRQPHKCHWLKVQTIDRPNRTILEATRTAWIAENGSVPPGNGPEEGIWNQPIDARTTMAPEEQEQFSRGDQIIQGKLLKQAARRLEAEILTELQSRGVTMEIRFNPKLKETGLLDLK